MKRSEMIRVIEKSIEAVCDEYGLIVEEPWGYFTEKILQDIEKKGMLPPVYWQGGENDFLPPGEGWEPEDEN